MKPSLALMAIPALVLSACGGDNDQTAAGDEGSAATSEEGQSTETVSGETVFKRCVACHTIDKGGRSGIGPNLHSVVGSSVGSAEGFAYSTAMKSKGGVWDEAALDSYIASPIKYLPGTRMSFAGIADANERTALIKYLKEQK